MLWPKKFGGDRLALVCLEPDSALDMPNGQALAGLYADGLAPIQQDEPGLEPAAAAAPCCAVLRPGR